ncbi:MAG: DMT family transporter [Planctomycetota bacterium]
MGGSAFAILTVFSAAAFNLAMKGAVRHWPVGTAGLLSRLVTVPLLAAWVLSRRGGWRRLRPQGQGGLLLLMSGLSIGINLMWFSAMRYTTAANVSMLMSLDLVFVVLIGSALGLERIGWRQLSLLPVLLVGMALLIGVAEHGWSGALLGDALAVGAALAYATNAFIIRRILRTMDEEAVSLYNHALSALGFVALVLLGDEFGRWATLLQNSAGWSWTVTLGVIAAVSLPIYYAALARLPVWKLRAWTLAAPVLVTFAEWQLWGTELSRSQWLGAAMVLGGLALLIRIELRMHRGEHSDAASAPALPDAAMSPPSGDLLATGAPASDKE